LLHPILREDVVALATIKEEEKGQIVVRYDKNRTPNYYVTVDNKVIFESDSVQNVVQWTIDNYTYNFVITFPYQPIKMKG
jgi:hypothetical protein